MRRHQPDRDLSLGSRDSRGPIFGERRWVEAGLPSGEIQQHHIRGLLHSFEDNFTSVWGDVEVANVEVGSEVSQLPLDARLQTLPGTPLKVSDPRPS